ncbi:MAG: thiamine pyrophosphate-binding protein [Armatimonadetes bacterium]|nr:thiamine pyrophosphate-binding protein [Armatimonadota bacterium]
MTGVELFASELKSRGVQWISTLCGHGLNPLYAACRDAGIRLVDTRNEQAAAYMAECWGRLSRTVGVCAVSSGVAHANAMTGVVSAHFDGAPMLLITGAGAFRTTGMGHFQDLDQVALSKPVCKYAKVIDVPERIPQFVHEAFAAALGGRPGPVHLTFPLDIQEAIVNDPLISGNLIDDSVTRASELDEGLLSEVIALLQQSERPLIIAGSGAYYSGAEKALADFAASLSLPILVPIWDRGTVPDPIPQFMGVLGAASGGPKLLPEADLVIMIGAAFDYRVGYLQPPAVSSDCRILRLDSDATRLHAGVPADVPIQADPRRALEQLTRAVTDCGLSPFTAWLAEAQQRREDYRQSMMASARRDSGLHALDILAALREALSEEAIVVVDGGNIGQWFHQVYCDRYPGSYLTCGASAVVGFGIAGAFASKVGHPDRPVVLLSGDGSITFTIAELECAARQNVPFVVLLADDESWGIAELGHIKELGRAISSTLGPVRFDLVAQGFGCHGVRISHAREIAPALSEGLRSDKPTLIHVPIVGGIPGG